MTDIRRYYSEGYSYFVTNVTYQRCKILLDNYALLLDTFQRACEKHSFDLIAWVIIPDHFHLLIHPRKSDPTIIMKFIKQSFANRYLQSIRNSSGRIWQYRFWDHVIRDEKDLERHFDYIHRNPVKHKLVTTPFDHPFSSIHQYPGHYAADWGLKEDDEDEADFGE